LKLASSDINIEIPKDSLIYNSVKEPNYGCLKNGSKPTFRELNKTQKHCTNTINTTNNGKRLKLALENNTYYDHSEFHNKYQTNNPITNETNVTNKPNIELKIAEKTSEEIVSAVNLSNNKPISKLNNQVTNELINSPYDYTDNYFANNKEELPIKDVIINEVLPSKTIQIKNEESKEDSKEDSKENSKEESYIPKLRRITRTYKYKLGKRKDNKHIGLLIKNRETQKKIKQEVSQLKQQPIQDVKNFLREKNLIKLGSQAPNDVLRKLYEDSILAGEITNTNNNNLVHNYLNDL